VTDTVSVSFFARVVALLVLGPLVAAACAAPRGVQSPTSVSESPAQTTTSVRSWKPLLIDVEYRDDPVDVAAPWFESLGYRESSVVDAAWYDAARQYLVIVLKGRAYHYCDLDRQTWTSFVDANSLGRFYTSVIRDNFDCRESEIPKYP
jgi:hypothetical protein